MEPDREPEVLIWPPDSSDPNLIVDPWVANLTSDNILLPTEVHVPTDQRFGGPVQYKLGGFNAMAECCICES